jgi:hypothetical protein
LLLIRVACQKSEHALGATIGSRGRGQDSYRDSAHGGAASLVVDGRPKVYRFKQNQADISQKIEHCSTPSSDKNRFRPGEFALLEAPSLPKRKPLPQFGARNAEHSFN